MEINEPIYGKVELEEPVLIELLESPALQRIKRVAQHGLPEELYHIKNGFSRYDHCLGTMLLLRKLGAGLEEQIAGLLHDVSHTAFSHVIDNVMDSQEKEDFQDQSHKEYIQRTNIPTILEKYGVSTEQIADPHNYPLLEQEIPDVCADRIDYAIREFKAWANPSAAPMTLKNLAVHEGKIVFTSHYSANIFARTYLRLQSENWGSIETKIRYELFSRMLTSAIDAGVVLPEDLYQDDNFVLEKLRTREGYETKETFRQLAKKHIYWRVTDKNPQFILSPSKFRHVDPLFVENGAMHRLSEFDADFKVYLEREQEKNGKEVRVSLE